MALVLDALLATPLQAGTKGLPDDGANILLADVARQRWNLLEEQIPLPGAVIKQSALEHNAAWMRDFLSAENALIAPHGKTTMAPQLFDLQLTYGAWGMTVATVQQLQVCRRFGVQRVLMANQLVGLDDIRYVATELARDDAFEFYCLVDSIAGAERLQDLLPEMGAAVHIRVLLEIGIQGGRTGCRSLVDALGVAGAIAAQPSIELHGVACYEGIIDGSEPQEDERRIGDLLAQVVATYRRCQSLDLFANPRRVLLSAGGSAYFDIVVPVLNQVKQGFVQAIIRSGCYLTHDSVFYERHFQNIRARCADKVSDRLRPALEVWAYVQSVPEPGLAILTAGKRDVSYDVDLPVVEKWFRPGQMKMPEVAHSEMAIFALNDQHAYLRFSGEPDLAVGDMVALGISHPCTTFDKWQLLWLVDDDYNVIDGIRTFF